MLALSDSSTSSDWSASTVSPTLTSNSMILALPEEPISGTATSCTDALAATGAAAGAGAAATGAAGAAGTAGTAASGAAAGALAAGAALSPSTSSSSNSSPSFRRSPSLTFRLLITPALGAGISMLALSDSRVSRLWSASMRSPTLTSSSITSPSPLPISGTRISSLTIVSSENLFYRCCTCPCCVASRLRLLIYSM